MFKSKTKGSQSNQTPKKSKKSVKDGDIDICQDDCVNTNKGTNKNTNQTDGILLESAIDGIVITKNNKFWIYVISNDQWDILQKNIRHKKLHIGAYKGKCIMANDVILFYM